MKPRVFFFDDYLNKSKTSPALEFGEVKALFKHGSDRPSSFDPALADVIKEELICNNFDPSVDFIAVSGLLVNTSILVAVTVAEFKTVSLLLFDARLGKYQKTIIS